MNDRAEGAPDVAGGIRRVASRRLLLLGFAAVLSLVAVQLLRQPGVRGWDGLWQEDGTRWLTGAVRAPLRTTLTQTYNGYLHVVPRLIAAVTVHLPVRWFALSMTLSAALLVAALAVHLYLRLATLLPGRLPRVVAATFFVLAPATGAEANVNVTNLHWYLDIAALAALLPGPRRRVGVAVDAVVALAAALSDPLCALWLPVAIWRFVRFRRDAAARVVPAALVLGLLVQLGAIMTQQAPRQFGAVRLADVPVAYVLRVGGSFFVGDRFLVPAHRRWGSELTWLLSIAILVLVALVLARARGGDRWVVLVALAYSLLWFCLPVLLRGSHFQVVLRSLNGQRYEVVPVLALALALLVAVAGAESAERVSNRAVILACAFLVAMMALNLTQPSSRSGGPHYRATVAQARLLCHDQPVDPASNVRRLPGNTVSIPVSPRVPPGQRAPWFVVVPCGRLG